MVNYFMTIRFIDGIEKIYSYSSLKMFSIALYNFIIDKNVLHIFADKSKFNL